MKTTQKKLIEKLKEQNNELRAKIAEAVRFDTMSGGTAYYLHKTLDKFESSAIEAKVSEEPELRDELIKFIQWLIKDSINVSESDIWISADTVDEYLNQSPQ